MPFTADGGSGSAVPFSTNAFEAVAAEVGRQLAVLPGTQQRPKTVRLTESFPVWQLTADRLRTSGSDDLTVLADDLGRWHHQIAVDGKPTLYARSASSAGPVDPTKFQVYDSPLAAKYHDAIRWVDENEDDGEDFRARVLVAPSYHLQSLWLLGESGASYVRIVDAARRLQHLDRAKLYPSADFVQELRRVEPVKGVVLDQPLG
jgi:hypothetical protein